LALDRWNKASRGESATVGGHALVFDRDRAGEAFMLVGAVRSRSTVIVDRPAIRHNQSDMTTPDNLADIMN
jgi:hypothetical protein